MGFNTDKQTLDDLKILSKPGTDSVYGLYNNTYTKGGADILEQMFLYPLSDAQAINNRSATIQYFKNIQAKFPFKTDLLDSAEIYMAMTDQRTKLRHDENNIGRKIGNLISADGDYKVIYNGIIAIVTLLHTLNNFVKEIGSSAFNTPYDQDLAQMLALLTDPDISPLVALKRIDKLSHREIVDLDHLLRFTFGFKIKKLLSCIYQLDVYIAIAEVAFKLNYVFPVALTGEQYSVKLAGVYHPLVKNALANSIDITPHNNVVFLTGANMAGKSTFMKTVSIALYLAHMGFPVAAQKMEFSVMDGLFTTINLPDDLGSGNSHFYAEVLRVKKIAKELGAGKKLFVVFDELFRGTNVKDAYEGTIAITKAFAEKRNCMFVVSTHIIEAGEVLRQDCSNINFVYLPTLMEGNSPVYTYKLKQGITADRHGMIIINNERILEIIGSRKNKKAV
ncbi:DNA mismatch repair protein [Mucilaginibacter galii]|uniref:DNA mismatch repair protein MutS n=1 Tax=Mucilaginibacter galii TaxID=2005073 RepID=A0A917J9H2_9SPHI|nr:DNA mismatch repair protein [Mucilaginibacter galii]GGI51099.1 DNA mismatch repair protein MutS [Mucilaginibacter galii]